MSLLTYLISMYLQTAMFEDTADRKSIECMVYNLYHESRGEDELGHIYVAQAVINRTVDSEYPTNPCDVIYQPGQFSWTDDGLSDEIEIDTTEDVMLIAQLIDISANALDGTFMYIHNSTSYYAHAKVSPCWETAYDSSTVVGNHTFVYDYNNTHPCWTMKMAVK